MPAPIMADLRAAKAVMFAERVEPDGRCVQFWEPRRGRRRMVMVELHPDGRAFVWESTAWRNRASGET